MAALLVQDRSRTLYAWVSIAVVLAALEGAIATGISIARASRSARPDTKTFATELLSTLPPGSMVGSWNAGIFGYFSEVPVVNLDGLVNHEIVNAYRAGEINWPYWVERGLTHLVDDSRWFEGIPSCYHNRCLTLIHEREISRGRKIVLYAIRDHVAP